MPYQIQEPAEGRPEICVPVFMNVCAGSWLICSVCIERTTAISSAMEPMCGRSVEISCPDCPQRWNECCGPKQRSFCPWSCAMGCPLVRDSGMGWPSICPSFGLESNSSRCEGPPAW